MPTTKREPSSRERTSVENHLRVCGVDVFDLTGVEKLELARDIGRATHVRLYSVRKVLSNYIIKHNELAATAPFQQQLRDLSGRFAPKSISFYCQKTQFKINARSLKTWFRDILDSKTMTRQYLYDTVGGMESVYVKPPESLSDVPKLPENLVQHPIYQSLLNQAAGLLSKLHKMDKESMKSALIISFINMYTIIHSDNAPCHRDLVTKYGSVVFVIEQKGKAVFQVSRDPVNGKKPPKWSDIEIEEHDAVGFVSDLTHQYLHKSRSKRVTLNLFF